MCYHPAVPQPPTFRSQAWVPPRPPGFCKVRSAERSVLFLNSTSFVFKITVMSLHVTRASTYLRSLFALDILSPTLSTPQHSFTL